MTEPIVIAADGRCNCTLHDHCPRNKHRSSSRCTEEELLAAGVAVRRKLDSNPKLILGGAAERLVSVAKDLVKHHSITVDGLIDWMRLGARMSDIGVGPEHIRVIDRYSGQAIVTCAVDDKKPLQRYKLQNRFQDDGWEDLDREFANRATAIDTASKLSKDPFLGMIRVVNLEEERIVVTYAAGGGAFSK